MRTPSTNYRPTTFTGKFIDATGRITSRDIWGNSPASLASVALWAVSYAGGLPAYKATTSHLFKALASTTHLATHWGVPLEAVTQYLQSWAVTAPKQPGPPLSQLFSLPWHWPHNFLHWGADFCRYMFEVNLPLSVLSWFVINSLPNQQRMQISLAANLSMMLAPTWAPYILLATAAYSFTCQDKGYIQKALLQAAGYVPPVLKLSQKTLPYGMMLEGYVDQAKKTPDTGQLPDPRAKIALFHMTSHTMSDTTTANGREIQKLIEAIVENQKTLENLIKGATSIKGLEQVRTSQTEQELASVDLGAGISVGLLHPHSPLPNGVQYTTLTGSDAAINPQGIWVSQSDETHEKTAHLRDLGSLLEATMIFCAKQDTNGQSHIANLLTKRQLDNKAPGIQLLCQDLEICSAIYALVQRQYGQDHTDLITFYQDDRGLEPWPKADLQKIKQGPEKTSLANTVLALFDDEAQRIRTHYTAASKPSTKPPARMLWTHGTRVYNAARGASDVHLHLPTTRSP